MPSQDDSRRQFDVEALAERIYQFALRIIRLADALPRHRLAARVIGWQLVKAGTSIAFNYEEVRGAISHREFVAKLGICYKECRETVLALRFIQDGQLLPSSRMNAIIAEGKEIRAILGTSFKTARSKQKKRKSRQAE